MRKIGFGLVMLGIVITPYEADAQDGYRPPPDGGRYAGANADGALSKPGPLSPTGPHYAADQIRQFKLAGVSLDMIDKEALAALTGLNWARAQQQQIFSVGSEKQERYPAAPIAENVKWLETPENRDIPFVEREAQVWRRAGEGPTVTIYRIRDASGPIRPGKIEFTDIFDQQQSRDVWKERLIERYGQPTRERDLKVNEVLELAWELPRQVLDWDSARERDCSTPGQGGFGCNNHELRKLYRADQAQPRLQAHVSPSSIKITLSDEGRMEEARAAAKAHADGLRGAAREEATKSTKPQF